MVKAIESEREKERELGGEAKEMRRSVSEAAVCESCRGAAHRRIFL